MANIFKKYKYYMLVSISLSIIFVIGFFVGKLYMQPKKIALGGYSHDLLNEHVLNIWYHDNGNIATVAINNVKKNDIIVQENFYPSGVLMSDYRRTPEGLIFSGYFKSGILEFKDHIIPGCKEYKREHFSEDGTIIKTETLGGDITDDEMNDIDGYGKFMREEKEGENK